MTVQVCRVNRSKHDASRAYDQLSRFYDALAGSSEARFRQQGLEMLAVQAGEAVLEIGPGTGTGLVELCRQAGASGLSCGIDLSPGMLRKARQNLAKAGLSDQTLLSRGDGAHLPFSPKTFTALFMSFTLELFDTPEIQHVLAECQRVLRPGGRLGVVSLSKPAQPHRIVRLYEWLHERFPAYLDCRPINADAMILAAGFCIEQQKRSSMGGLPVELIVAKAA